MLKRWVFRARRKEGCESMSLILTGRLFQMSGPQTEKARRPNYLLVRRMTADLAVVDRSWRRWGPLTLNVTRSLRYGGERLWRILCRGNVANIQGRRRNIIFLIFSFLPVSFPSANACTRDMTITIPYRKWSVLLMLTIWLRHFAICI